MNPADDDLSRAFLELASGSETSRKLPLGAGNATLGRVPGNTHVLDDKTVSRQHAKLFVRDGRHWIADQNSTAGTFVNGERVTLQALADGDEVRVGTTRLTYRRPGTPPKTAPPIIAAPPVAAPRVAAPPRAAPPIAIEPPTGSFDLELPASAPPSPPIGRVAPADLPPPPRSGLTQSGEDPFALEAPGSAAAPQIELRGATARNFGSRPAGAPAGAPVAAASPGSITAHVPPPIAIPTKRSGAFAFMGDDLNQRGGFARFLALLLAISAAVAIGWLALEAFDAVPKHAESADDSDDAPTGPSRPQLPERR